MTALIQCLKRSRITRKRNVILFLLTLSIVYVSIQIFILAETFMESEDNADQIVKDEDDCCVAIERFMEVSHSNALPVFLIDTAALNSITGDRSKTQRNSTDSKFHGRSCQYLCTDRSLTSFGVLSHLWRPTAQLYEDLAEKQFTVLLHQTLNEEDEIAAGQLSQQNLTHTRAAHVIFSFRDDSHYIHLVVFYQRGTESYLWHAALDTASLQKRDSFTWLDALDYGLSSGAYESLDLNKLVVDGIRIRVPNQIERFLDQRNHSRFIDCNLTVVREFHKIRAGDESNVDAEQFQQGAYDLLRAVKHVLDKLSIRFWICSGTCLGWFRQCDLIPYSNDVDIGIWIKDYRDELISELESSELRLVHLFGKVNDSYELSFKLDGRGLKLDVFFFYEEADYMWNGGTQAKSGLKFKYIFPKFTLCWAELIKIRVRVPCETEDYIKANYGPNWLMPVLAWDWKKSPSNVIENGAWPHEEWSKVIQIYN